MWRYLKQQLGIAGLDRKLDRMSKASEALGRLSQVAIGAVLALRAARDEVARLGAENAALKAENARLVDEDAVDDAAQLDAVDTRLADAITGTITDLENVLAEDDVPGDGAPVEGATEPELVQPDTAPVEAAPEGAAEPVEGDTAR